MSFAGRSRGDGRDSYHHGNLREALVAAALTLIAERGLSGFAFAELARAAGVSAAAPYRHFRDRNAVIIEVARRGFEQLRDRLEAAYAGGKPDPLTAIEACSRAHIAFARAQPAFYAAMFETGFPHEDDAGLATAADQAFAVVRGAAQAACAACKTTPRPPALMVALHVWSLTHGIATLFVGGARGGRWHMPMAPEELLEAGLLIYFGSLGLTVPHTRS